MSIPSKPSIFSIKDAVPKASLTNSYTDRYYSVTLTAGAPMGLLLALTYPTSQIISSSFSP